MDLSKLDVKEAADRGADMVLRHPATGEELFADDGTPIVFKLLGSDSQEYRRMVRMTANKNLKQGRQTPTVERFEQNGVELLVAVTVGWSGVQVNGEMLEFSPANARQLYTDYRWIQEQVDQFVAERANFLTNA